MFRNFDEIVGAAKKSGSSRICIVFPEDRDILRTVFDGMSQGLIEQLLIGSRRKIEQLAQREDFSLEGIPILDEGDPKNASEKSVKMVRRGILRP